MKNYFNRNGSLFIGINWSKIVLYIVVGCFVLLLTILSQELAIIFGLFIGFSPLYFKKIFNIDFLLFSFVLSLILEKYSYYVGFSIRLPMLFIVGIAIWVTLQKLMKGQVKIDHKQFVVLFGFMLFVFVLGGLGAENRIDVVRVCVVYLFLFSIFFITIYLINDEKRIRKATNCIILTAILGSLYGFYQIVAVVFNLSSELPFTEYLRYQKYYTTGLTAFTIGNTWVARINSTFNDPVLIGVFAGMALMLLCSTFCFRLLEKNIKGSSLIYYISGILILFFCVIFTFSRSSWLGLLMGFLCLSYYLAKRIQTRIIFTKALFSLFFVLIVLVTVYPEAQRFVTARINQSFDFSHVSTSGHAKWFEIGSYAWSENPLLGVGLNNFGEFNAKYFQGRSHAMTHSAFLSFLAETGLIGFILELSLIFLVFRYILTALNRAKTKGDDYFYYLLIGVLSGYTVILAANITYHFYTQFYVWFYMGFAVATSSYVLKKYPEMGSN